MKYSVEFSVAVIASTTREIEADNIGHAVELADADVDKGWCSDAWQKGQWEVDWSSSDDLTIEGINTRKEGRL